MYTLQSTRIVSASIQKITTITVWIACILIPSWISIVCPSSSTTTTSSSSSFSQIYCIFTDELSILVKPPYFWLWKTYMYQSQKCSHWKSAAEIEFIAHFKPKIYGCDQNVQLTIIHTKCIHIIQGKHIQTHTHTPIHKYTQTEHFDQNKTSQVCVLLHR